MKTDRRNFIKAAGMAGTGMVAGGMVLGGGEVPSTRNIKPAIWDISESHCMNDSITRKMRIKPVAYKIFGGEFWEGPCRTGCEECLTPEGEKASGQNALGLFLDQLKANLSPDAIIMEPVFLAWQKGKAAPEEELRKLDADSLDTDLFLVCIGWGWDAASYISKHYNKPVATMWSAFMGDKGEGYPTCRMHMGRSFEREDYRPIDFDDLNRLISVLRVRRAMRESRVLEVHTEGASRTGMLENLKSKYGLQHKSVLAQEIYDEMDRVIAEEAERTQKLTHHLIYNAHKVHMKQEDILPSVSFYVAARNLMERYKCNAFSFPCYETCLTKIPHKKRFTPCLAHSLLKDEGFPSVCEGDIRMLPAMMLLMYISKKSIPMGNSWVVDKKNNLYGMQHDVPGLKMKGFDKADLSYEIVNFTEGGWGATIRRDYSLDKGQAVTIAAFNSSLAKLLVVKGEMAGSIAYDEVGCRLMAVVRVPDVVKLYHEVHRSGFIGHHSMVYGDYTQDIVELGELMGFEVVLRA